MAHIKKLIQKNKVAEQLLLLPKKKNLLTKKSKPLFQALEKRIPKKLQDNLEGVFVKVFKLVFDKGTPWIERTYNKVGLEVNQILTDHAYEERPNFFTGRKLDKRAKSSIRKGKSLAFVGGASLGFLGIGLPDIPVFTGVLLKGIYEIALSYGFNYHLYEEKLYLLKLIQAALASEESKLLQCEELDQLGRQIDRGNWHGALEGEIHLAAKALSSHMLVAKFVQGLPVVGAAGAIFNHSTYKTISDMARIKYKKRYLEKKLLKRE